jgi:hypothetical protein
MPTISIPGVGEFSPVDLFWGLVPFAVNAIVWWAKARLPRFWVWLGPMGHFFFPIVVGSVLGSILYAYQAIQGGANARAVINATVAGCFALLLKNLRDQWAKRGEYQ